jgi:hypothetical protein
VNGHDTAVYLSHFRTNLHYNPRWSPEIYSLSEYINKHGFEVNRIISVDLGDAQPAPRARAQETPAANAGFVAPFLTLLSNMFTKVYLTNMEIGYKASRALLSIRFASKKIG